MNGCPRQHDDAHHWHRLSGQRPVQRAELLLRGDGHQRGRGRALDRGQCHPRAPAGSTGASCAPPVVPEPPGYNYHDRRHHDHDFGSYDDDPATVAAYERAGAPDKHRFAQDKGDGR